MPEIVGRIPGVKEYKFPLQMLLPGVGRRSAAAFATPPGRDGHFRPLRLREYTFPKENQHCIGAGRGVPGPPAGQLKIQKMQIGYD